LSRVVGTIYRVENRELQVLTEDGIEYVQDPASGRYMPTLHRIKDESILNSESFNEAVSKADVFSAISKYHLKSPWMTGYCVTRYI